MPPSFFHHEQELAQGADLKALLPMIRRGIAIGSIAPDGIDDLVALYEHEFVLTSIDGNELVPDEVFQPDGMESLLQINTIGPVCRVRWDSVSRADWGPCGPIGSWVKVTRDIGREFRFVLQDGRTMRCLLPEEEAAMVIVVLQRILGSKAMEIERLPPFPGRKTRMRRPERSPILWRVGIFIAIVTPLQMLNDDFGSPLLALVIMLSFVGFIGLYLLIFRSYRPGRGADLRKRRKARQKEEIRKQSVTDFSGKEPLRLPWLGGCLKVIGGLILLLGLIVQGMQGMVTANEVPADVMGKAFEYLSYITYAIAAIPLWFGYRLMLRPAAHSVDDASGSPILFLRPFALDNCYSFNPDRPLTTLMGIKPLPLLRKFGPLGEVHPLRLIRLLLSRGAERAEEQMAVFFKKTAPFVAIGRPGERFATPGAQRVYISHLEWQNQIIDWLSRSRFVVLQPASSQGVVWEIKQSFAIKNPSHVLLCLAHLDGSQARWDAIRLLMERELTISLPRSPGAAVFVHFADDGTPERLPPVFSHPMKWTWTGCCLDFKRTLAPFLIRQRLLPADTPQGGRRSVRGWAAWWPALLSQWIFFLGVAMSSILALMIGGSISKDENDHWTATSPGQTAQTTPVEMPASYPSPVKVPESIAPDGWILMEHDLLRGDVFAPKEGDVKVGVLVRGLTPDEKRSPGSSATPREVFLSGLQQSGVQVELIEQRERSLDDYNWTEADYRLSIKGQQRWLRIRYITPGDKIVMFTFDLPESTGLAGVVKAESDFDTKAALKTILEKLTKDTKSESEVPDAKDKNEN